MRRTGAGLAILAVAAALLAGCGRSTSDKGAGSAASIGAGPATGTLTVWAQGAEAEQLPTLLKAFKAANPQVTVNVTAVPWDSAHNKYQTAIAGGTTPDIGQLGTTWMNEFATAGALAPTPDNINADAFYPGATASTRVRGGVYGIPWYVDTPVVYYRTDLAARAGFTSPPATWTDFKNLAKAYQTKAGAKYGVALPPKNYQSFLTFGWSNGGDLTTASGTQWTLDSPAMVDAMRFYQSFFTEGIANKSPSTDDGAVEAAFVDGSVPMFIGGPYEVSLVDKAGGPDFAGKYATAMVPKGRTATSFVGGADLVVFKKSHNPAAAWKLIQFLSQPDAQVNWYKTTGDLPSVQSAWNDPTLRADAKLAVFGEQLKDVKSPPADTSWAQVAAAGDTQMERVTVSGLDPAKAAQALQSYATSVGTGS